MGPPSLPLWLRRFQIQHHKYIPPGESEVLRVQRHWIAMARPLGELFAVITLSMLLAGWLGPDSGRDPLDTLAFFAILVVGVRFLLRYANWKIERVIVTNKRVIELSGVFNRRVASMPLSQVTDLTYKRSVLGRMLKSHGYGELILESPGQKQAIESIPYLPTPDPFYRQFVQYLNEAPELRRPDQADTGEIPQVPAS